MEALLLTNLMSPTRPPCSENERHDVGDLPLVPHPKRHRASQLDKQQGKGARSLAPSLPPLGKKIMASISEWSSTATQLMAPVLSPNLIWLGFRVSSCIGTRLTVVFWGSSSA